LDIPQSTPAFDPASLARRIGDGDADAEAELVRRYGPKIEFILRHRVREPSLVADLRQETLIVVLRRLRGDGLDEPDKLAGFVRQTAVNLALGESRTWRRRNTWPDDEAVTAAAASDPLIADRIDREQLARMIRQLIDELGQPRDRQLLRRFYLSEEPKESLCASLAVTPEHFDRILYRARQRFRQILARHLDGDFYPK